MYYTYWKGGQILKKRLYKLLCLLCVCTVLLSIGEMPSGAINPTDPAGNTAYVFAHKLEDAIERYGVVKTEERGGSVEMNISAGIYPTGVIYGDIIDFDNNESPYLVIFRSDGNQACASIDVYGYNAQKKEAELKSMITRSYNLMDGKTGAFTIGCNDTKRYIVYNEFIDNEKTRSDFYTIIDGTAFRSVSEPEHVNECAVFNYSNNMLHPDVDVSNSNRALNEFVCFLKDSSADSVSYADISDAVVEEEEAKIEKVLKNAAKFTSFDICEYKNMSDYNTAQRKTDCDNIFYSVTNLYDLGDQLYYVRFATDKAFYNHAILRRTQSIDEGYQLLAVETDSVPLSDMELEDLKTAYAHNKLVYKKDSGSIVKKAGLDLKMFSFDKIINVPKPINSDLRRPAALIGGAICLVMFVVLWVYMASDDE